MWSCSEIVRHNNKCLVSSFSTKLNCDKRQYSWAICYKIKGETVKLNTCKSFTCHVRQYEKKNPFIFLFFIIIANRRRNIHVVLGESIDCSWCYSLLFHTHTHFYTFFILCVYVLISNGNDIDIANVSRTR